MHLSRRSFLSGAAAAALPAGRGFAAASKKPNIIHINVDTWGAPATTP